MSSRLCPHNYYSLVDGFDEMELVSKFKHVYKGRSCLNSLVLKRCYEKARNNVSHEKDNGSVDKIDSPQESYEEYLNRNKCHLPVIRNAEENLSIDNLNPSAKPLKTENTESENVPDSSTCDLLTARSGSPEDTKEFDESLGENCDFFEQSRNLFEGQPPASQKSRETPWAPGVTPPSSEARIAFAQAVSERRKPCIIKEDKIISEPIVIGGDEKSCQKPTKVDEMLDRSKFYRQEVLKFRRRQMLENYKVQARSLFAAKPPVNARCYSGHPTSERSRACESENSNILIQRSKSASVGYSERRIKAFKERPKTACQRVGFHQTSVKNELTENALEKLNEFICPNFRITPNNRSYRYKTEPEPTWTGYLHGDSLLKCKRWLLDLQAGACTDKKKS